jgi:hypothetical protein
MTCQPRFAAALRTRSNASSGERIEGQRRDLRIGLALHDALLARDVRRQAAVARLERSARAREGRRIVDVGRDVVQRRQGQGAQA